MSELVKSAEALFEVKTVPEVRQIEDKTRQDIETKKKQLRQLVGDSYRDLIESADKVLAVAQSCSSILAHVQDVQRGFSDLGRSITSADVLLEGKRDTLTVHEQLYGVGKRVKYLVDTPEMIWGCLDSKQYLEAARRFLRAQEVHTLLKKLFSMEILSKFPLITHQWPLVLQFKSQLVGTVSSSLSTDANLSTTQCADALAAVAALNTLDTAGALQVFLTSRRSWVQAKLRTCGEEQANPDASTACLCDVAHVLQSTLCQVGELFLPTARSAESTCLLQNVTVEDEMDSSELVFGGEAEPNAFAGSSPEAEAWRCCVKSIQDRLTVLAGSQVEQACIKWLRQVVEDVNSSCPALLRSCATASSLSAMESAIISKLSSWQNPNGRQLVKSAVLLNITNTGRFGAGSLQDAPGETWDTICEVVLGKPTSLWQEVFYAPFMLRAKELIDENFIEMLRGVLHPLQLCLDAAAVATPVAVGEVVNHSWPVVSTIQLEMPRLGSLASSVATQKATLTGGEYRLKVQEICAQFDEQLKESLNMVLMLLRVNDASEPVSQANTPASKSGGMSGKQDIVLRASELEPFVQQKCTDLVLQLSNKLQEKLSLLGEVPYNTNGARIAEQALIIGRLASALAVESKYLPVVMGPPENWRGLRGLHTPTLSRLPSLRMIGSAKLKIGQSNTRLVGMMEQLQGTAVGAYRMWSMWASVILAADLQRDIIQADVLRGSTPPLSWVETVVTSESNVDNTLDEILQDMRFSLPACPSTFVLSCLSRACQEARRAGDHNIGLEALQVYEWELGGALIAAVKALLQPGAPLSVQLSDRGVLQLLMDVRFIRDVLAGGRPMVRGGTNSGNGDNLKAGIGVLDLQDPVVTSMLSERRRDGIALEAQLQERLDPIDWATYEPYLWANVQKYYQRVSIMFGTLIQLHRAYPDASSKVQLMQEINVLNVLPVSARFQYLPITAPAHQLKPVVVATQLSKTGSNYSDIASDYSFTDVGSGRLATTLLSHKEQTSPAMSQSISSASAFSTLQAKLGQLGNTSTSFSTFGSILGDKAAEMTAMAQQKFENFGDYLPTGALGSASGLFNQLTKGVGKK